VEHFTLAVVEVSGAHDGLKCFIFESNLRDDCKFWDKLRLRAAKDKNELLMRAQPYINYKEKKLAEEALKSCKQSNKASNDGHRSEEEKIKALTLTPQRLHYAQYVLWNHPPGMLRHGIQGSRHQNTKFAERISKNRQIEVLPLPSKLGQRNGRMLPTLKGNWRIDKEMKIRPLRQ
jgi:hypothetical protein